MATSYFFCTSVPLDVGSIVRPGNWGRILKRYSPQITPNSWLLTKELIFELVRREFFPVKPSRFDAVFLCPSHSDLRAFRESQKRLFDMDYEVEIVDENAPTHQGDWGLLETGNNNYSAFEENAKKYWQGLCTGQCEIITTSSIRVKKVL